MAKVATTIAGVPFDDTPLCYMKAARNARRIGLYEDADAFRQYARALQREKRIERCVACAVVAVAVLIGLIQII